MSDAVVTAQRLESLERQRLGSEQRARSRLADKLRVGIGTLENIVRGRVKTIDYRIKERLDQLLIRELEAEIARLSTELEMARQSGCHPASQHVCEVEAHLAAAKKLMRGEA